MFFLSLPAWVLLASVFGLYRQDDGRIGHSTVDDLFRIVQLVTLGAWMFFLGCWATGISNPRPGKLIGFWLLAIALVTTARAAARSIVHRSHAYVQRTVIVGGGDVGQLVARKLRQHDEYRESLIGIVDDAPRSRRVDMGELALLGSLEQLPQIVVEHEVDRVIVAFSNESDRRAVEVVRSLRARRPGGRGAPAVRAGRPSRRRAHGRRAAADRAAADAAPIGRAAGETGVRRDRRLR